MQRRAFREVPTRILCFAVVAAAAACTFTSATAGADAPPGVAMTPEAKAEALPPPPPPSAAVPVGAWSDEVLARMNYLPRELPWEPGDPVPPGYEKTGRVRAGLVTAGSVVFGFAYTTSVVTGVFTVRMGSEFVPLFVPVVGPFIAIGTVRHERGLIAEGIFLFAFNGTAQLTGAVLLIAGLVAQKPILVRTTKLGGVDVRWTPVAFGKTGPGLGLAGTF
jgi:hypothetical protein